MPTPAFTPSIFWICKKGVYSYRANILNKHTVTIGMFYPTINGEYSWWIFPDEWLPNRKKLHGFCSSKEEAKRKVEGF